MADWQVVSVLKKSKVFQVQSNTIFNLRDLTEGVPWGNVTLDVSISSVDMGYDVISLETSYEDLGNNQYRAHVYRYKLYPQTMQYLNVPVNGVWNTYYLGEDCGGVSISGQVSGSTNPSSFSDIEKFNTGEIISTILQPLLSSIISPFLNLSFKSIKHFLRIFAKLLFIPPLKRKTFS